jgi:hypothetical protein
MQFRVQALACRGESAGYHPTRAAAFPGLDSELPASRCSSTRLRGFVGLWLRMRCLDIRVSTFI